MIITRSNVPVHVEMEEGGISLRVMPHIVNNNIYNQDHSLQELFVGGRKIFLGLADLGETSAVRESITWTTMQLCLSVLKISGHLFTEGSFSLLPLLVV